MLYKNMQGPNLKSETFTANGTWTRPDGVDYVNIVVVAGGGGGASAGLTHAGGGGGAGGILQSTVNVTGDITVTVGEGGANNADGAASSFGSYSAEGGKKGLISSSDYDGLGGSGSNLGQNGIEANLVGGAGGSNSITGKIGGIGGTTAGVAASANSGAGGGGGRTSAGGAGGSGVVIIQWFE